MPQHLDKAALSLQISGTIQQSSTWDTTLWFSAATIGTTPADLVAAVVAGAHDPIVTFGGVWGGFNDSVTDIRSYTVRYYAAGESGASQIGSGDLGDFVIGHTVQGGPASQCVVTTLLTALATRSGRGRLYWPATGALPGTLHAFDPASCQALALATVGLYGAISALSPSGGPLDLIGGVRSLKLQTINQLTAVRVDTRPDRQEHRENHLPFTNHVAPFG